MKNPLHYQLSEYDCGPTTMLNAVSYLFDREEIPPELIRNVMLYSLDCYGKGGAPCKAGTSRMAMMFLANWLDGYGQATSLPLSSVYLAGKAVSVRPESRVLDALHRGGVDFFHQTVVISIPSIICPIVFTKSNMLNS